MEKNLPKLKKRKVVDPATATIVAESVVSSGNVFADLGFPNPEEHKLKSGLMLEITRGIKGQGLTQTAAAKIVGVSQGRLSEMMNGQFRSVSIEQLFKMLNRLGRDVEVRVGTEIHPKAKMRLVNVASAGAAVAQRRPGKKRASNEGAGSRAPARV